MQKQMTKKLQRLLILSLIGCFAYFAGYIMGQKNLLEAERATPPPAIQENIAK